MDENRKAILQARQKQIDKITKGFDNTDEADNLEKAVYVDNPENRRLNRVGQTYGGKKEETKPTDNYYEKVMEDFVDEDTGDQISFERIKLSKSGEKVLNSYLKKVEDKYRPKLESEMNYSNTVYEKWINLEGEISDLKATVDEMGEDRLKTEQDMEEEMGKLGMDDDVSNEYGNKFNEIDDEMKDILDEIKMLEPRAEKAQEKLHEARRKHSDTVDKMRKEKDAVKKDFEKRFKRG